MCVLIFCICFSAFVLISVREREISSFFRQRVPGGTLSLFEL